MDIPTHNGELATIDTQIRVLLRYLFNHRTTIVEAMELTGFHQAQKLGFVWDRGGFVVVTTQGSYFESMNA